MVEFDKMFHKHEYQYVSFGLKDESVFVPLGRPGKASKDISLVIRNLPKNTCAFVVFDHHFVMPDGRPTSKCYFLTW